MKSIYLFIAVIVFLAIITRQATKEPFTDQQKILASQLVGFFRIKSNPSFTQYLELLPTLENTSDKLISKAVFNKFINNPGLTEQDVLNEI